MDYLHVLIINILLPFSTKSCFNFHSKQWSVDVDHKWLRKWKLDFQLYFFPQIKHALSKKYLNLWYFFVNYPVNLRKLSFFLHTRSTSSNFCVLRAKLVNVMTETVDIRIKPVFWWLVVILDIGDLCSNFFRVCSGVK